MSWIQLTAMGGFGAAGALVDSGLGGASKFDMVMAMLRGFGIGVLGFAFVSVIAQLSPSVRALAAMFGSILSLTGGIVAARDSYEEGKYEQAAFRMLMGIFGCIMGARDYRNALRDCNVSVAVDETPNGGGGRGCVGEEDVNARITGSRNGSNVRENNNNSVSDTQDNNSMRYNFEQQAVIDLANRAKRTGGVSLNDAYTLLEWAEEYNVPAHGPEIHPNRPGETSNIWHFHIGRVGHIPIIGDISSLTGGN